MDLGKLVEEFLTKEGAGLFILAAVAWFFVNKVWPFFTTEYFPQVVAREKARTEAIDKIGDVLLKLEMIANQQSVMVRDHDQYMRGFAEAVKSRLNIVDPPGSRPINKEKL